MPDLHRPWVPTDSVGPRGARAWTAPQPDAPAALRLDPGLAVMVLDRLAYGWTHVQCENGWETWVSAEDLGPVTQPALAEPAASTVVADAAMIAWLAQAVPALRQVPGPGGYPAVLDVVVPPPPPLEPGPPAAPEAPAVPSRAKTPMLLAVSGVIVAVSLGALGLVQSRSNSGISTGVSVVMLTLMTVAFALSLVGARTPTRQRVVFDLLRACASLGAVVAIGRITGRPAPAMFLIAGPCLGVTVGVVEGVLGRVVVAPNGRRFAHRAITPLVFSFVGLTLAVAAALGSTTGLVQVGQTIGISAMGLQLGVPLGRVIGHSKPKTLAGSFTSMILWLFVAGAGAGLAAAPILLLAAASSALAEPLTSFDGDYGGKVELDPSGGSKYFQFETNEVKLSLLQGHLSGTIRISSSDNLNGNHYCGYDLYTFTGRDMQVTRQTKTSFGLHGDVQRTSRYSTSEEDTCTRFDFTEPSKPETLDFNVSVDGIAGRVKAGSNDGGNLNATLTTPAPGSGGSPGGGGSGSDPNGATTGTLGAQPPGSIDKEGPQPQTTPGTDAETVKDFEKKKTAETAIAVVNSLVATGVITAAEGAIARKSIEKGDVPGDVLTKLAPKLGDLGVSGAITGTHVMTPAEDWESAKRKLAIDVGVTMGAEHPTLTMGEYLGWLKHVEGARPGATWQEVTSAIHDARYGGYTGVDDTHAKLPHTDINLFEPGSETSNAGAVRSLFGAPGRPQGDLTSNTPWYIVDHQGRLTDVNHAMAGLRSDINRPAGWVGAINVHFPGGGAGSITIPPFTARINLNRDFLRWANTDLGDTAQVYTDNFKSWHPTYEPKWAPPDQRLGNSMGVWLSDFYRTQSNQQIPLSQAMERYLDSTKPIPR